MNEIKCPICGNPGIPDYHKENVVCSHCGSDLKIYKYISDAVGNDNEAANAKHRKYKILLVVIPLLIVLLAGIAYHFSNKSFEIKLAEKDSEIVKLNKSINELNDSVKLLLASASSSSIETIEDDSDSGTIEYVVVQNDGPWIIVNKIFGKRNDWEYIYRQIAKDNGLWDDNSDTWKMIHPGQILIINKNK